MYQLDSSAIFIIQIVLYSAHSTYNHIIYQYLFLQYYLLLFQILQSSKNSPRTRNNFQKFSKKIKETTCNQVKKNVKKKKVRVLRKLTRYTVNRTTEYMPSRA